jgi:peptide/nickel transport system substrate-binding protein
VGYRRRRTAEVTRSPHWLRLRSLAGLHRRSALVQCTSGVLFVLGLSAAACTQAQNRTAPAKDVELRIGVPEGNTAGPELGVHQLAKNMSLEALTQITEDGRALPRLAASWQWDDERHLRIRLREGVLLHDGSSFDAQTSAEALAGVIADPSNRDSYPALADVRGAIPIGKSELILELAERSPQLPVDLTVLLDIPAGPFQVTRNEPIELKRFDHYYQGVPSIARVTIRPFDAMRTTWASLLRGELDMVYDVPVDTVEFVRNDDIDVVSVARWYQHQLIFNVHDRRFKSAMVRRALNLAVDRAAIIRKVLHGAGEPSAGPIYPKYWGFDSSVPKYAFDPQAAAALLDEAGYHMPSVSTNAVLPARLRFTCLVPKDFTVWQRIALEVQRDLFNVGVDMQFKVVPLQEFTALVFSGRFEAAFVNIISGPTPSRSFMWWRSSRRFRGVFNAFGYENEQAEEQYDVLVRSANEAAIRSATSKLQRVLYDDPPALFVAWDTRTRAIHRRFVLPADERDPMWALWKWTVAREPAVALAR